MKRFAAGAVSAVILFVASCASSPAQNTVPDWVLSTPRPDATYTYFTGSSSNTSGDEAAAMNDAAANLIASITQYIGVRVDVSSTAEARATLDSYTADIKSTVVSTSKNQVSGFTVKERYIQRDKKTGRVTVYILASYVTSELEKEKARIAAVFKEREDAVARPESEGRSLESAGRLYEAVRKYVEAAVAASGSDIDNAALKLERNINNARSALSKLRFVRSNDEVYTALVGQPFPKPFKLRLVAGEGSAALGVPGAALQISYQRASGTRLVSKTESAMTASDGGISFTPPPPDFVGKAKLVVKIDFQSTLELLDKIPAKYAALRNSLEDELRGRSIEIPYEVLSAARNASMAVSIVDAETGGALTQAALIETLLKEKFNIKSIAVNKAVLEAMDDGGALSAATSAGKFDRVVYGFARISEVHKDGSSYVATATATIKVLAVATGNVLYSAERTAMGVGSSDDAARKAAYRELGANAVGKDLLSKLP
jgi:opacity protein-like surface antigen